MRRVSPVKVERRPSSGAGLVLSPGGAAAVLRGHPWVYREAIDPRSAPRAAPGSVVDLCDAKGKWIARGLWDESSPIAVRVITCREGEAVDADMLVARLARAIGRRRALFDEPERTNAYRLCHGEGDRLPGLVVDRYADIAVVRTDGEAMAAWATRIIAGSRPELESLGIRAAGWRRSSSAPSEPLFGSVPESTTVRENGFTMHVDLLRGQKTGAFLDQRENRARVFAMANGKRVLNLFSYAGGFSLAAALGGARHVTSVDIAHPAHATAQRSFRANQIDPSAHAFVTADAFAFLETARARGERWDLIVSDPPSFAPNERSVARALTAYRRLHAACAAVLHPGGTLCAASCSSHVSAVDFLATLDDASLGRDDLALAALHGPPPDHPIVAAWPEGLYLKFAVLS